MKPFFMSRVAKELAANRAQGLSVPFRERCPLLSFLLGFIGYGAAATEQVSTPVAIYIAVGVAMLIAGSKLWLGSGPLWLGKTAGGEPISASTSKGS